MKPVIQAPEFSDAAVTAIVIGAETSGESVAQLLPPEDFKEYAWLLLLGYREAPDPETADFCERKLRELAEKFGVEFVSGDGIDPA